MRGMSASRFDRGGVSLAYDERGDRDSPAVVLLHGLSGSRVTWEPLATRLSDRFRVIAVDLRGHGESDRASSYRLPDYGSDVAALCESVVGGEAVLVGHSLGGITTAFVAATRPDLVRGAFLEDPPMFVLASEVFSTTVFAMIFPILQQSIRDAQATGDPDAALRQLMAQTPAMTGQGTMADALGPEGVERTVRSWSQFDAAAFDPAIGGTMAGDHDLDAPIGCPVTLVRADPSLGPAFFSEHEERFRRLAPQSNVVVADGCTHLIHDEKPDWFADEVEKFLSQL